MYIHTFTRLQQYFKQNNTIQYNTIVQTETTFKVLPPDLRANQKLKQIIEGIAQTPLEH